MTIKENSNLTDNQLPETLRMEPKSSREGNNPKASQGFKINDKSDPTDNKDLRGEVTHDRITNHPSRPSPSPSSSFCWNDLRSCIVCCCFGL